MVFSSPDAAVRVMRCMPEDTRPPREGEESVRTQCHRGNGTKVGSTSTKGPTYVGSKTARIPLALGLHSGSRTVGRIDERRSPSTTNLGRLEGDLRAPEVAIPPSDPLG